MSLNPPRGHCCGDRMRCGEDCHTAPRATQILVHSVWTFLNVEGSSCGAEGTPEDWYIDQALLPWPAGSMVRALASHPRVSGWIPSQRHMPGFQVCSLPLVQACVGGKQSLTSMGLSLSLLYSLPPSLPPFFSPTLSEKQREP
uniref:Uncharacterized protein n=1 Tax=Pipistrellus kuhlii TaxID=59472 RepID=A0A7J7RS33_PIPKU|nr:hypothetical protein mPipKuh1_010378 [Pipistrellus kuhlii]